MANFKNKQAEACSTGMTFRLDEVTYDLAVTDIRFDEKLHAMELEEYFSEQFGVPDGTLDFTISLGEPLDNGYCFKLVAAVLQLPFGWPSLE